MATATTTTTTATTTATTATQNYDNTYQCIKCYAKHLAKAAVEFAEVLEDKSRRMELALCIGDLACAEDHATSLLRLDDKREIKNIRDRIWDIKPDVLHNIQRIAAKAAGLALTEQELYEAERQLKFQEMLERRKAAKEGNDASNE